MNEWSLNHLLCDILQIQLCKCSVFFHPSILFLLFLGSCACFWVTLRWGKWSLHSEGIISAMWERSNLTCPVRLKEGCVRLDLSHMARILPSRETTGLPSTHHHHHHHRLMSFESAPCVLWEWVLTTVQTSHFPISVSLGCCRMIWDWITFRVSLLCCLFPFTEWTQRAALGLEGRPR